MVVRIGTGVGNDSFKSVDIYPGLGAATRTAGVTSTLDGTVYASGWVTGSAGVMVWTTRKGVATNGIWAWSTDDSFSFVAGQYTQARGVAATSSGDLFAIGAANGHSSWIVRRKLGPTSP